MELQLQNTGITRSAGVTSDSSRQLSQNPSSEGIGSFPSLHNTPIRLKENGQVLNLLQQQQHYKQSPQLLPMPNICGDLPTSNIQQYLSSEQSSQSGSQYPHQMDQQQHHQNYPQQNLGGPSSTLPSNKRKQQGHGQQQQRNPLANLELSMPDAILAAAMMLNYRQNNASQVQGGGDPFFGHKSMPTGKRSSLNMKEQLLLSAGIGVAAAANTGTAGGGGGIALNTTNLGTPINATNVLLSRAGVVGNSGGKSSSGYNPGSGNCGSSCAGTGNGFGTLGESSCGGGSGSNISNIGPNVIQFDFDSTAGVGSSSKTVPRPPKRHTPTVKFSPDTFSSGDGSICSAPGVGANVNISSCVTSSSSIPTTATLLGSQSHGIIHPGGIITANTANPIPSNIVPAPYETVSPNASATATQLKSSLKKHSNYSTSSSASGPTPEEMNV
jgi:hypothetical protein